MSKAKGNRTKRKCIKYYENKDWIVESVEDNHKYALRKDLFNLFDLIAIKEGVVLFIQVKTNQPATQAPYKEWAKIHCNEHVRVIVWTWYDREGPRIQEYIKSGDIIETDER